MRAGNIGSLRSCAVSTSILSGPFGVKTAIKSARYTLIFSIFSSKKRFTCAIENRKIILCQRTPDTYYRQDYPGRPLWQIFNKNESHKSGDEDEICLLQRQRALPVYTYHSDEPEIPQYDRQCYQVHWNVVSLQNFPGKIIKYNNFKKTSTDIIITNEYYFYSLLEYTAIFQLHLNRRAINIYLLAVQYREEEEQHERAYYEPSVYDLVESVFVQNYKNDGHAHDDSQKDQRVRNSLPCFRAAVRALLVERCVNPTIQYRQ